MPALAQDTDAGGLSLTFGVSQRLEATTARDLSDDDGTGGVQSDTILSFGALTQTRTQLLALDLSGGLRVSDDGTEAADPDAALRYVREGADATFDATAAWTRSDIDDLRDPADFVTADGTLDLPSDFSDLTGTGTRTVRSAGVGLQWGETAPLGYNLSADVTDIGYDGDAGGLNDSTRTTLGAGLRLTLDPVTDATVDLRHSIFDEDGSPTETSDTVTFGVIRARPRGDLRANVSFTRDDDGDLQTGLSVGRAYALPTATLDVTVGVAQDGDGDPQAIGRLSYTQDLPDDARFSLSGSRSVSSSAGTNSSATILQGSYLRPLTPLATMQVGFDYLRARDDDDDVSTGSLNASLGYQVNRDWQLNLGVRADLRREDGDTARAATTFVTVGRSFTYRP